MADLDSNHQVNSAHSHGITCLSYTPDGKHLYTAGQEGIIRCFDTDLSRAVVAEPTLFEYHDDPVTCVSTSNEYLCSASEAGLVVLHTHGSTAEPTILMRCSFSVRSASFDPKGKRVAVASDELFVKIVDVQEPTKVQLLTGHKKAVREATWSPDGSLLTTSGSDGQLRVWELNGTEATCIQVIDGLIIADDPESEFSVAAVWHPSGKYFVVPSKTHEIVMISRDTWAKIGTFSSVDGHTSQIASLAFSSNGQYLASSAKEGSIIIWATNSRTIVNQTSHLPSTATALAFHPASGVNKLAYVNLYGEYVRWSDPVPSSLPGPSEGVRTSNRAVSVAASDKESFSGKDEERHRERVVNGKSREIEAEFPSDGEEEEDTWIDDDDGNAIDENNYGGVKPAPKRLERWDGGDYVPPSKAQEAFQPGATPVLDNRRYLAFNMLGFIHAVERDERNIVTIEFHDRGARTGSHFNDEFRYTLAALGELGAVFACPSSKDSGSPSYIHYRPYESWTTAAEWRYTLPSEENATLVAVGGMLEPTEVEEMGIAGTGTILVATDKGFVRFFSGSGNQKYVWNFGEEIVSMAAAKDWACIVHRGGATVDGQQNLDYSLVDTDTFEVIQAGRLPLGKGKTVSWIGFSDQHIPAMYDSEGLLSILDKSRRPRQARWVPVLDTNGLARRVGKQESYWPIGVTDTHAHIIILKGGEKYPGFPTPLFQELELQMPILRLEVEQGRLEEQYIRGSLFLSHRRDGTHPSDYIAQATVAQEELTTDKYLLKLIQTACKSDKLHAALDLALLISQPDSLGAAAKIAGFFTLDNLKERILLIKDEKMRSLAGDDDNKREGKWSHLVDDRTILGERSAGGGGGRSDHFFESDDRGFSPPSSTAMTDATLRRERRMETEEPSSEEPSSYLKSKSSGASKKRPSEVLARSTGEEMDVEGDVNSGEDDSEGTRDPKRLRSQSAEEEMEEEQEEEFVKPALPVKRSNNPFAKRPAALPAPRSSASSAFASKSSKKTVDMQRTDSFFSRVENSATTKGTKTKSTKTKEATSSSSSTSTSTSSSTVVPGTRQTTLFGLAPGVSNPSESKRGRKKKATEAVDDEEASESTAGSKGKSGGLGAFLNKSSKELPREGEEFEETQMTEVGDVESQVTNGSESQNLEETQEETQTEESQMEDTQEETQVEEEPAQPLPKGGDGISKLAAFRMAASVPAVLAPIVPSPSPVVAAVEAEATSP